VTDQARIHNIAASHADNCAEHIAKVTRLGMTVLVTVYSAGEIIAEGFATTDDYRALNAAITERDPDA
jgi:hypothetical protein